MALTDKLSAIGEAIRAKTGKSDKLTLDQMPGEIASITGGGGGSSADVRYVTFMNGDTFLYKKPVAVGDDCVNVLSKGLISTPTKESTAQYNYTYYGWGASDGGAYDANILKNITEDKTVYAIFTSTVRYYTITYYDSDGTTVLKTESLAYGAKPSYTPMKNNHTFLGWTPTITTVTGNATYTAQFAENVIQHDLTDGVLTISGAGAMEDYAASSDAPWYEERKNIKEIIVEPGITRIGQRAFTSVAASKVTLPETVTSFGDNAFYGVKMTSITIPSGVTSISNSCFWMCTELATISLHNGITSIGDNAFRNCSKLTSFTFPDSVTSIGTYALAQCTKLTSVVLPQGITSIPAGMFDGSTALRSVTIPNAVTSIGAQAFIRCNALATVALSNNLVSIGDEAFSNVNARNLKETFTIPASVTRIGMNAFKYQTDLTGVVFENTSGWYVTTSSTSTGGTSVDVTDAANAKTLLTSTHVAKYWNRK